jgi:hypothetical protein
MKYIITEEQSKKLEILRRIEKIDDVNLDWAMSSVTKHEDICELGLKGFIQYVSQEISLLVIEENFPNVTEYSDDWYEYYDIIKDYITNTKFEEIETFYYNECSNY